MITFICTIIFYILGITSIVMAFATGTITMICVILLSIGVSLLGIGGIIFNFKHDTNDDSDRISISLASFGIGCSILFIAIALSVGDLNISMQDAIAKLINHI